MKIYKRAVSILLMISSLVALSGCRENRLDERLIVQDLDNYTDCPQHNIVQLDFFEPDVITLVKNDTFIQEYSKGDVIYEKIFQMQETTLENYYQEHVKRTGKEQVSKIKGTFGQYSSKKEQTYLTGGTYIVYTYFNHTYAPVYFQISNPAVDVSSVMTTQNEIADNAYVPYGFYATQELWDYLSEMEKE